MDLVAKLLVTYRQERFRTCTEWGALSCEVTKLLVDRNVFEHGREYCTGGSITIIFKYIIIKIYIIEYVYFCISNLFLSTSYLVTWTLSRFIRLRRYREKTIGRPPAECLQQLCSECQKSMTRGLFKELSQQSPPS